MPGKFDSSRDAKNDYIPETMEIVESGTITGTIGRNPYAQGHDPAIRLYNYLVGDVVPEAGEVHAVVGENGAGKSTLMKILGGIVKRDGGIIKFDGEEVEFANPLESIHAGISIIHQELSMLPSLNVIENVWTGRIHSRSGLIPWKKLEEDTKVALARVGLDVDPHAILDTLSISHRQLIEVAKALSIEAKLIIMDEPNSSLTESESERLFEVIGNLQSQNISVIYVSHKIEEVLRISDRVTVLRDGNYVGTMDRAEATVDQVIQMMVGRELTREHTGRHVIGDVRLSVRGLTVEIEYEGRPIRFRNPQEAIENGVAMGADYLAARAGQRFSGSKSEGSEWTPTTVFDDRFISGRSGIARPPRILDPHAQPNPV